MVNKKSTKQEEKDIVAIRNNTLQQISTALSKPKLHQHEVYTIVKDFFKKILDLDYEFTHQELLSELKKMYLEKKHHQQVEEFITTIGAIEYSDKEFTQAELKTLLTELKEIVNSLIKAHKKEHAFHILLKHLGLKKDIKQKQIKNTTIETDEDLYLILSLIEGETKKNAQKLYEKALRYYNSLDNEKKKQHFERLKATKDIIAKK